MGCMAKVNVKKTFNYTQNSIAYVAFFFRLSTSAADLGNVHVRVSMHKTNEKKIFF